ncbi:MAG: hypothetical protein RSE60_06555 [Erysipelotrichaceae bacterium]
MWNNLPKSQKEEYKRLILAFSSLTGMFAQKSSEDDSKMAPIINSKFQETAFQRAFNAFAEDIGNTSYDVSLQHDGEKYLVGIKTFGFTSGDQKVAQFKAKHDECAKIIEEMKANASKADSKDDINDLNKDLYLTLAKKIAKIRNARIDSSRANIKGFMFTLDDSHVHSVYHVLMPSSKNKDAKIFVGETAYDKIDIEKLKIKGCTTKNNPTNFFFSDGKHSYKYTTADSQLHMNFDNENIVCEEWNVKFVDDAYAVFGKIADILYPKADELQPIDEVESIIENKDDDKLEIEETYCWTIWNKQGETELYSGFNSFFGTGSKMGKDQRKQRIDKLYTEYESQVENDILYEIKQGMTKFLLEPASSVDEKAKKVRLREYLVRLAKQSGMFELKKDVYKMLYRPMDEMYIPIPDSAQFHKNHPDFFGKEVGKTKSGTNKLELPKEARRFDLVFDPSGDVLPAYITQDNGKAIESAEKQTYLGEWILRGIFQLDEYEPLTSVRLVELNINGLRFTKYKGSEAIHIEFIWIDENNPPTGFITRK